MHAGGILGCVDDVMDQPFRHLVKLQAAEEVMAGEKVDEATWTGPGDPGLRPDPGAAKELDHHRQAAPAVAAEGKQCSFPSGDGVGGRSP